MSWNVILWFRLVIVPRTHVYPLAPKMMFRRRENADLKVRVASERDIFRMDVT